MKIHNEGIRILLLVGAGMAAILSITFFLVRPLWVWFVVLGLCLFVLGFIGFFFRYPMRSIMMDDGKVIAPADGKVVQIKETFEKEYLKENVLQVSIFMSLANVHINFYPVGGRIVYYKYHAGDKLVAWHPKSSEKNEHTTIVVDHNKTLVAFRQIAGLIAQRIVCYAQKGKHVQQGSEVGLIRFGSRVDIFLPLGTKLLVRKGQKVIGQITPIAEI